MYLVNFFTFCLLCAFLFCNCLVDLEKEEEGSVIARSGIMMQLWEDLQVMMEWCFQIKNKG